MIKEEKRELMEKKQDKTIILGIGVFFLLMGIVIFQVLQRKLNSDPY